MESKLTVSQLKEEAKQKGIRNYSTMNKANLLSALRYKGYITSWEGLEDKRQKMREFATMIREQDTLLEKNYTSAQIIEGTSRSIRGKPVPNEFVEIGVVHNLLLELNKELVLEHGLNFFFVRKEWVSILNPVVQERDNCDVQIEKDVLAF